MFSTEFESSLQFTQICIVQLNGNCINIKNKQTGWTAFPWKLLNAEYVLSNLVTLSVEWQAVWWQWTKKYAGI